MPLSTATGDVSPHSDVVREFVEPSCDLVVSVRVGLRTVSVYFDGTRGSPDEKKGIAFFTRMLRALPSRLSPTRYRRPLFG